MDTTPQDNKTPIKQQAVDTLDMVSPHVVRLSGGERLLPYLLAAMETCWVDVILIGLAGANSTFATTFFVPLWVPFVFIAGSYWLAQRLEDSRTSATHDYAPKVAPFSTTFLVVILLVGTLLFSLWSGIYASSIAFGNPAWLGNLVGDLLLLNSEAIHVVGIVVVILYFYWRGLRLSHSPLEPGHVFTTLRIGLGVLIAVVVLRAITHTASSNEILLLLLIPLFLMLALIAHALAHTVFVRITHRSGLQGSVTSQERALLGIITAFGSILLLLSLLVGAVASPAFLADAQRIFMPIVVLYDALANILAFALALLITPIIWLLNLLHFRLKDPNFQARTSQALCKQYPHSTQCTKNLPPQNSLNPLLVLTIKILLPVLVIILVVLIARLLLRRRRISVTRRITEVHESVWSWELFWTQLRALLRAFWLRLFPQQYGETDRQESESDVATEPKARSIREVYRAMLRWAALRGYPRKRDETPYEFRTRLRTRLPFTEPEISTMTEVYTAIRYGSVVPSEDEVAHIQQSWQQLQRKTSTMPDKP
jgi:hypothetical protein